MKKSIIVVLKLIAVLFLIITLLFAWAAFASFLERANHGAGLMFADVEIFLFLTIVFLLLSFGLFWFAKKNDKSNTANKDSK